MEKKTFFSTYIMGESTCFSIKTFYCRFSHIDSVCLLKVESERGVQSRVVKFVVFKHLAPYRCGSNPARLLAGGTVFGDAFVEYHPSLLILFFIFGFSSEEAL
jgi:hypothetical protein